MQEEISHSQIPAALIACYQTGVELPLRIREIRQARKMTLAQLAEAVGVSIPHLSEVERGKKNLNNHLMTRLANALDCSPSDLILGSQAADYAALQAILSALPQSDIERVMAFARALAASTEDDKRTK